MLRYLCFVDVHTIVWILFMNSKYMLLQVFELIWILCCFHVFLGLTWWILSSTFCVHLYTNFFLRNLNSFVRYKFWYNMLRFLHIFLCRFSKFVEYSLSSGSKFDRTNNLFFNVIVKHLTCNVFNNINLFLCNESVSWPDHGIIWIIAIIWLYKNQAPWW